MADEDAPGDAAVEDLDAYFSAIAEDAIQQADEVPCRFDQFVDGLRIIEAEIRERRVQAEIELRSMNRGDDA